ncbi:exosome component 7 [Conidiobolus coronatus NRRL 28638]|uniref:Ribosomal RNA-processing protein 42 n=1 Tax=Conidiobolus coronatus (strain ATCC 28846 / CBS 209.66 / NRRL 28638) TaxID=796925 RepID=A0A137P232_CONC2|nr:exosome component 7 [Conidiobolus coronatus NRRL 28638]|eukprot:KXN69097.1 exosome component 7 [Conidiobolus coronatus NRRL 28638]
MFQNSVSFAEKDFIIKGIESNIRLDGRSQLDYRPLYIETSNLPNAHGSSRVRQQDGTDLIVGIKAETSNVDLNSPSPNKGKLICSIECAPNSNLQFRGRTQEEINTELTQLFQKMLDYPGCGVDLESLLVIENQTCWHLYIDVLVLGWSGSLVDCISVGIRAALANTKLPKVIVHPPVEGVTEFEIIDDNELTNSLKGWEDIPLIVSLNKIGEKYVVDATLVEEGCAQGKVMVGVNKSGRVALVQKVGRGAIDLGMVSEMVETGKKLALVNLGKMDERLASEKAETEALRKKGNQVSPLGFLAH